HFLCLLFLYFGERRRIAAVVSVWSAAIPSPLLFLGLCVCRRGAGGRTKRETKTAKESPHSQLKQPRRFFAAPQNDNPAYCFSSNFGSSSGSFPSASMLCSLPSRSITNCTGTDSMPYFSPTPRASLPTTCRQVILCFLMYFFAAASFSSRL